MPKHLGRFVAVVGLAAALTAPVAAAEDAPRIFETFRLLEEVRLGAYAHNPHPHISWYQREISGLDISGEVLSSKIWTGTTGNIFFDAFLQPRMHFGAMVSTNNHNSYVFAGLTWRIEPFKTVWRPLEKVFFEGEFGGAANDAPPHWDDKRTYMGCHVTFRESAGIGYQFTQNWSIIATGEHISHADLCANVNPGQTNYGIRIGYKF